MSLLPVCSFKLPIVIFVNHLWKEMKGKCAIKQTVVGRKSEEQTAVHTLARLYAAESICKRIIIAFVYLFGEQFRKDHSIVKPSICISLGYIVFRHWLYFLTWLNTD